MNVIHVLATTAEGTTCALRWAKRVAAGLDARIVIFVRVPKGRRHMRWGGEDQDGAVDRYRAAAAAAGVPATLLACIGNQLDDVVRRMVAPSGGPLIVGGRCGWWWPTREQRLFARLAADGYPVIFAPVGPAPGERTLVQAAS